MTLWWYHTSPNWKKWPSDFWALSYCGLKNRWPTKTTWFRSKGELSLITKVSEIFQQTIVLDWLVKARLGSFLLTSMRPLRFLRFKDKRHGAPSDLLRRTLVPSLCHLGPISGHLGDTRVCSPTVEKHVLLQGFNSCELSVCPLQQKEKMPWNYTGHWDKKGLAHLN